MMFPTLDQPLVRAFYRSVVETGAGVFCDPRYPYQVTVTPKDGGYHILIEDLRKRWWGRKVDERMMYEHMSPDSISQGPAHKALFRLELIIKDDPTCELRRIDERPANDSAKGSCN